MSQKFNTNDGASLRLGRLLGQGGEGSVYEVEGAPAHCAKVYASRAGELHDKLRVMVANPPHDPTFDKQKHHSICWPVSLLYRGGPDAANFAGFVMPRIEDEDFRKAICRFHPEDRRKLAGRSFSWQHAYNSAMNIASAVAAIHEKGYCIGDINESNILVAGNTLATVIDCDSFQVREPGSGRVFRCLVGKGEYTAPELAGATYAEIDRTPATDYFGLAVLLFQFLMEGCHPYQSRGPLVEDAASTEKKISLGFFPYRHAAKPAGVDPPVFAPPFDILHPDLQNLFVRAFVAGHADPAARPTSKEWFEGLRRRHRDVAQCGANKSHRYSNHLGQCPWCRMAKDGGTDPFSPLEKKTKKTRTGVATPGTGGRARGPSLRVPVSPLPFRLLSPGLPISGKFTVENAGSGALAGSVWSNELWLKVGRRNLDPNAQSQEIGFEIDTTDMGSGVVYSAQIVIDTTGGRAEIEVLVGSEIVTGRLPAAAGAGKGRLGKIGASIRASTSSLLGGAATPGPMTEAKEILIGIGAMVAAITAVAFLLISLLK